MPEAPDMTTVDTQRAGVPEQRIPLTDLRQALRTLDQHVPQVDKIRTAMAECIGAAELVAEATGTTDQHLKAQISWITAEYALVEFLQELKPLHERAKTLCPQDVPPADAAHPVRSA